ncbi:MAG: hypothetical protein ACLU3N_07455 [Lachnospiraceae bacterium]
MRENFISLVTKCREKNPPRQSNIWHSAGAVDPVYSGKALAALIAHVKSGKIPQGSCVVFWHTGGATALFAEHEIVGDLSNTLIYDH